MPRLWGFWTRGKLDLLRQYLDAFTTASTRSSERIYLDVFGGQPENLDRLTKEELEGSARIALSTDNPPFTKLRMFEVEPYASRLKAALAADFPGRDCIVIPGDCNQTIRTALTELESVSWAPTFAFVDPNGPDTHWATLEALAAFRRARQGWKAEVLLLFADGMFIRMLPVNGKLVRPEDDERITTMYGTEQWKTIYEARLAEEITPAEAREEYVNLMRWRIENDLGYRWTHPFEVFNERGHSIYHMIFATDHPAGNTIMSSIYTNAAKKFPAMREAARHQRALQEEQAHGVARLFDPTIADPKAPVRTGELLYEHAKPWRPMGLVD